MTKTPDSTEQLKQKIKPLVSWLGSGLLFLILSFPITWYLAYPDMTGQWYTNDDLEGCYCNVGPYMYGELRNINSHQLHLYEGHIDLHMNRAILEFKTKPKTGNVDSWTITLNKLADGRYEGVDTWTVQKGSEKHIENRKDSDRYGQKDHQVSCNIPGFSCSKFLEPKNIWKAVEATMRYWMRSSGSLPTSGF